MATTRKEIRRRLNTILKEPMALDIPAGFFLPNGTSSSIIRCNPNPNLLWPDDDWWHKVWIYASTGGNAGSERRVYDYVAATGDIYVTPAFTSAMTVLDELEIHSRVPATHKNERINAAIRTAWPFYWEHNTVNLVIPDSVIELNSSNCIPFPTTWREILEAWLEPSAGGGEQYTATSATTTTITVSTASWTTNAFAGWRVAITDGTGQGQERDITSNTATVLTTSAFTTAADSTSEIMIKEPQELREWIPVTEVRPIGSPYLERIFIPRWLQNEVGRTLRITGLSEPAPLTSDTASTALPADYIAYHAASEILIQSMLDGGTHQSSDEQWTGRYFRELAEQERTRQGFPQPPRSFWKQPRSSTTRSGIRADNPFWW